MLQMCEMFHTLEIGNYITFGSLDASSRSSAYSLGPEEMKIAKYYKQVEISGTLYKIGTVLVTDMRGIEKKFGEIVTISALDEKIFFHFEISFSDHYHAYIVSSKPETRIVEYKDLPKIVPCLAVKQNKPHFIATRYGL